MKKVNDFYNKLAIEIDSTYFPNLSCYRDSKECSLSHYDIELFNNGCLTYHELVKRLAKNCKEKKVVIHSIVSKYIEDFDGYVY